jgi:hypothetical protein
MLEARSYPVNQMCAGRRRFANVFSASPTVLPASAFSSFSRTRVKDSIGLPEKRTSIAAGGRLC